MVKSKLRPRQASSEYRIARKVKVLESAHGTLVRELINSGRLPAKEIGNFYGRHADRRASILAEMQAGKSYSQAYKASGDSFDTNRWEKVPNRTAAYRGHLLKTTAGLVAKGLSETWSAAQIKEVEQLATYLACEAQELLRQMARYEMKAVQKQSQSRTRPIDPCSVDKCKTSYAGVATQLNTALTKLRKNNRDVPLLLDKVRSASTVHDVARTAVEAGRIINGVPLFIAAIKSTDLKSHQRNRVHDSWGVGIEYASWLEGRLALPQPAVRIATHRNPDADALVAAWLTERFLFSGSECQVEFVPRNFLPEQGCLFDAVVDVGRMHDSSRLIFDHKPPAFQHRDEECATSLVWRHARVAGCQVDHLKEFVELVHDGDAVSRRQRSAAYKHSRTAGFHAVVKAARAYSQHSQMLYQGIAGYLDALFISRN